MSDVKLLVNGTAYAGWKTVRVTRGIECIAGSFELSVSDRWAEDQQPWPIREEDECEVRIGDVTLITGYVDSRSISYSADGHSLSVSGRDKTGNLVDSSALLEKWEFKGISFLTFIQTVAEAYEITVTLQPGLTSTLLPAPPKKLSVDPGDTAFDAIDKACRLAAVLPVSDGQGGLLLTRTGSARATTELVEGQNILAASADFDASGRFRTYYVLGQHKGTDEFSGEQTAHVSATAEDETVRRQRALIIRPEGNITKAHAKARAQWEASVRAARADAVSVTVQGWTQGDGSLWPINAIVRVRSPLLGIDGDMLITQATYSLDDSGTTTQLSLKNAKAFKPEPTIKTSNNYWKEVEHGV